NGEDYSDFLENNLPELLEDIDLNLRRQIWFQHDGVPPQNSRLTQQVLNTWYPHSWISRGVDFFLWNQFIKTTYTVSQWTLWKN
ncbi:unnamed protein product, partial [Tenebrio molitor]